MSSHSNCRYEPRATPDYREERQAMVEQQLRRRGVQDQRVLEAMGVVPRHIFVDTACQHEAYTDRPLAIAEHQTISQPFVVAASAEAAALHPQDRVLEVGTGSGYAAAVLSVLCHQVYTVERHRSLAETAQRVLHRHGYHNVQVRCGDGTLGWADYAPFDAILVTAAGPEVPPSLLKQLRRGGKLIMPVGAQANHQELLEVTHHADGHFESRSLMAVRFVRLIGKDGWPDGTGH